MDLTKNIEIDLTNDIYNSINIEVHKTNIDLDIRINPLEWNVFVQADIERYINNEIAELVVRNEAFQVYNRDAKEQPYLEEFITIDWNKITAMLESDINK